MITCRLQRQAEERSTVSLCALFWACDLYIC